MNDDRLKVLIVEDEPVVSALIRTQVTKLGYTVVGSAHDGPQAVELTRQLRPDVVLMDLQMTDPETGQDDQQAGLHAAREIQMFYPTPVVLLTAYESQELIQQASEIGAGAYLVKPARDNDLNRAIAIARARFDDIMELRRLNAEITRSNEELDAFSHTVAHGLKTPLAMITGYAELVAQYHATMPDEELRELLQSIVKGGHKMHTMIEELLLLSEVRRVEVEVKPLDMASVVAEAKLRLVDMIADSGAEIVVPDKWPPALGYGPWVEEVWVNYLSNALKYGGRPDEGIPPRVGLGFDEPANRSLAHSHIRFWVRDNGPGILPEAQARLFAPFTRLDQMRARGHGLGLSIVRRIVEKLGGQVRIESEMGKGSVFSFTLPAAQT